jgi:SPX domain protein involved in polyphosphate accumulation
MKFGKWLKR